MLKKINIALEMTKPHTLIAGLECFIALLRNKMKAGPIDVKLYLADAGKLQFKLRTIDAKKLTYAVNANCIKTLESLGNFPDEYSCIIDWCKNFTAYAEYHLDEFKVEAEKNVLQEEIAILSNELRVKNDLLAVLTEQTLVNFYEDKDAKRRLESWV